MNQFTARYNRDCNYIQPIGYGMGISGANIGNSAAVFSIANQPQFSAPLTAQGASTFGEITSTLNPSRQIQFALKYVF